MTDVTAEQVAREISDLLKMIAGPRSAGDTVQRMIERAARRCGLDYRRAWSLWYRPLDVVVRAHEADTIRARAAAVMARQKHLEELESENAALRRRLAAQDQELDAGRRSRPAVPGRCGGGSGMALAGPFGDA